MAAPLARSGGLARGLRSAAVRGGAWGSLGCSLRPRTAATVARRVCRRLAGDWPRALATAAPAGVAPPGSGGAAVAGLPPLPALPRAPATFTITTPLYYCNAPPHVGSAYPTILADALARYHRLRGSRVRFVVGTDEHGEKIARSAAAAGRSPREHVDAVAGRFRELWDLLEIRHDSFVRTSLPKHAAIVRAMVSRAADAGDVFLGGYEGLYCVGCEDWKAPGEVEGPDKLCPTHRTPCEARAEENYFFRASRYQAFLEGLLDGTAPATGVGPPGPPFVSPASRRNEVLGWTGEGVRDFSISRRNLPWGIAMPGDPSHSVYVWFDALVGYLTALLPDDVLGANGELDWAAVERHVASAALDREGGLPAGDGEPAPATRAVSPDPLAALLSLRGWPADVQIVGKDILRFHAVYWPAMLASAGLPPPRQVLGHGFLTKDGLKMGKSLGNVVEPFDLVGRFGADAVRFFLVSDAPIGPDGDISERRLRDLCNATLANGLGNLVHRCRGLLDKDRALAAEATAGEGPSDDWVSEGGVQPDLGAPEGAPAASRGAAPPAPPTFPLSADDPAVLARAAELTRAASEAASAASEAYASLELHRAAAEAAALVSAANGFLNERSPWKAVSAGPGPARARARADLVAALEAARIAAVLLAPVTPSLSDRVLAQLGLEPLADGAWDAAVHWGGVRAGVPLPPAVVTFQRIPKEAERSAPAEAAASKAPKGKGAASRARA